MPVKNISKKKEEECTCCVSCKEQITNILNHIIEALAIQNKCLKEVTLLREDVDIIKEALKDVLEDTEDTEDMDTENITDTEEEDSEDTEEIEAKPTVKGTLGEWLVKRN